MANIVNDNDFINDTVVCIIKELSGYDFSGTVRSKRYDDGMVVVDIMRNNENPMFSFMVQCCPEDFKNAATAVMKTSDIWRTDFFKFKKI